MENSPTPPASAYLLIFRNTGPDVHAHLTAAQRDHLAKQWNDWYEGLANQGKVQHGRPLGFDGRVISGARGERVVDGPYAEAKEVIGGYLFLTVADLEEATMIGRHCPGLAIGLTVEVRPVLDASPVLRDVRGHAPSS